MLIRLVDADTATCGGKAGALGALLRAGFPVPDGFVVPFARYRAAVGVSGAVMEALQLALARLGDPPVAVRSSAANEDTAQASAAGQHESVPAVHGAAEVADAVRTCWASLFSPRAAAYRGGPAEQAMAVLVQRHLDADVSGVMFTPVRLCDATVIEASWGLGPTVVAGTVTPDTYTVHTEGTVTSVVVQKRTRLDRAGSQLRARDVPADSQWKPALDEAAAVELAALGQQTAATLGAPQDIEWVIAEGRVWLVQARPITAQLPHAAPSPDKPADSAALTGTPGSHGIASGTARIVRGPGDFTRVRPGDILICPCTDPAWTPLLRVAAGVVTETGGVLAHAAIVAREHRIPAVLGTRDATSTIPDGATITVDGTSGTVTTSGA